MNLSLYIARRYFSSKKSHNAINIITRISMLGVAVGTMGLIVVLSVFNGLEGLVVSLYNSFDPDITITLAQGKTFDAQTVLPQLHSIKGVQYVTQVLEENALVKYGGRQCIATVKGVSDEFSKMTGIDTMMVEGKFQPTDNNIDYAMPGSTIASILNISLRDPFNNLQIYVPKRGKQVSLNPEEAFAVQNIAPIGFFQIEQEFDSKYIIVPLRFARKLLNYNTEVTSLELGLNKNVDLDQLQSTIKQDIGTNYVVKNRYQQRELLYRIMKSEKWAVFLILSFILLIATFNVAASLSMIIIDKKRDIALLSSIGANEKLINRVFLSEGIMITFAGAASGLVLGFIICFLQQRYGFVSMGGTSFVVQSYPVKMKVLDFIYVFLTVFTIGLMAAAYPAKTLLPSYFKQPERL